MSSSSKPTRSAALIAPALLILAAVIAYHGSLGVPFFFDDNEAITNNPTIRDLRRLGDVLSPPASGGGMTGRPVVNLSLAVNHAVSGTDVRSYHLFNLALHVIATLALFGIARRTFARPPLQRPFGPSATPLAFLLALLWTVHPLQTESVTCVIQRTELLFTMFYLLTLYAFVRSVDAPRPRPWQTLAITACALGMASKEVMVSAPLIVLLYDRTFVAGTFASAWRTRRGFHLGLAATWLILIALLVGIGGSRGAAAGFGLGMTWWSYALKQCEAIVMYLGLSLWPHPLVIDYGTAVVTNVRAVAPQALGLLVLGAATCVALKVRPVLGFILTLFFVVLAPSSSIVPLVTQTMAEHRMYLPLVTVLALLIAGGFRIAGKRIVVLGCVAAVGLGVATIARNRTMQDEVELWRDTVRKVPTNPRAHGSLGLAYQDRDRPLAALDHFRRALELDPTSVATEQNLGNVYYRLGDFSAALAHYQRAVTLNPKFASGFNNVGAAQQALRDTDRALQSFARALELDPDHLGALQNAARALFGLKRFAEAATHYEHVVRLQPGSPEAHYNLGIALARAGNIDRAAQHFSEALRLRPDAGSYLNLAKFLANAGRTADAITTLETALRLQPDFAEARLELERLRGNR